MVSFPGALNFFNDSFLEMVTLKEIYQLDNGMEDLVATEPDLIELSSQLTNEENHSLGNVSVGVAQKEDLDDYEEDESLAERLLGLTEMFPPEVRKCMCNIGTGLYTCTKGFYAFSCSALWLFFSSSAILFAPVLFELERAQVEEAQRTQQKQVLLGPNTAISNMNAQGLPMSPPVQR